MSTFSEFKNNTNKIFKREETKEEKIMNKDHAIGFGIGLLSGVVIGGVVALLFAPKTGKETRRLIMDKTTAVVDAVKEKASEVVDVVKDVASETSRKTQAAVKAIKD
jgi:gas vesicle protein